MTKQEILTRLRVKWPSASINKLNGVAAALAVLMIPGIDSQFKGLLKQDVLRQRVEQDTRVDTIASPLWDVIFGDIAVSSYIEYALVPMSTRTPEQSKAWYELLDLLGKSQNAHFRDSIAKDGKHEHAFIPNKIPSALDLAHEQAQASLIAAKKEDLISQNSEREQPAQSKPARERDEEVKTIIGSITPEEQARIDEIERQRAGDTSDPTSDDISKFIVLNFLRSRLAGHDLNLETSTGAQLPRTEAVMNKQQGARKNVDWKSSDLDSMIERNKRFLE